MSLPDDIVLVPSAAFGDGRHPTTRMCLHAVRAFAPSPPFRMLDVGSGTGVLAILAAKRGASAAIGVEIDEAANLVATINATSNGVGERVTFASTWPAGAFELVVANILRDVLLALRHELLARVADGGTLVLSGLTSTDVPALVAAYAPHLGDARPEIAHGVPEVSDDDARALIEHLRARPRQAEDDPSAWDADGVSVLAHAARRGDPDEVRALLARGARADEPCRDGTRPLSFAVSALALEVIEVLVSAGAKVERELLSAAFWAKGPDDRRAACLSRLAASGARASTELVWRAASFGRLASLRALLAAGGDPHARTPGGDLALVDGARDREVVALLLDAGVEVTARDVHGRSALELAIACGKPDVALLLVARGALVGLSPEERARVRSLAADRGLEDVVRAVDG